MLLAGPWWKRWWRRSDIVDWLVYGQLALAFVCALVWHPDTGDGFLDVMVAFFFWFFILALPYFLFGAIVVVIAALFRVILEELL